MPRWTQFRRLLGLEPAADVEAELAFHVEMRVRELIEQGETPERARQLALQRFGDYEGARQECVAINERRRRHMQRTEFMTELRQDIGYAFRMLRRTPAFTAAALVTLALGIGATSAIFSVVHGVLLESLPYRDAGRLHHLQMLYPDGTKYTGFSAPDFMSLRQDTQVFEQLEAFSTGTQTITGLGDPMEVPGAMVTTGLLEFLGLEMRLGRTFLSEESRPGRANVTVLGHGVWQRVFGADPNVLGRSITVSGRPLTVVGVLAPEAGLPYEAELFAPLEFDARFDANTGRGRRAEFLATIGRTRTGVAAADLDGDLKRIGARLQKEFPDMNGGLTFTSTPLRDLMVGDVERPLLMLLGAVGFVLIVACANVANLLLARGSARHGELAVRAALGAGRARLVRQLITEAVVLGLAGGALGLALAYWGTEALIAARPADLPRLDQIGLDGTVVLFTLGAALLTGLIFGMVPAVQATNDHLLRGLQESGRSGGGRRAHRMRSGLVVAEMALAVILLTGSGLLIRSFVELTRVNPGFQPEGAMAVRVSFRGTLYQSGDPVRKRIGEIEERLRALPGVTAVAAGSVLPLGGRQRDAGLFQGDRRAAAARASLHGARSCEGAARRDPQRDRGAALVPESGSDRQAGGLRRTTRGDRRGRRRAAAQPGAAGGAADVPAIRATNQRDGTVHRARAGQRAGARAVHPRADSLARSESADRGRHAAERNGVALDRAAAFLHLAADAVCRGRTGVVGDRHLRRDELHGRAAIEGDRHPDRAGRAHRRCVARRGRPGADAGGDRRRRRDRHGARARPPDQKSVVRRRGVRSDHAGVGRRRADRHRCGRQPVARPPRRRHRSDRGVPAGVRVGGALSSRSLGRIKRFACSARRRPFAKSA
jgi:hypothetical protein